MSGIAIPTPFAGGGLLFVSSGYVGDKLRPLYVLRAGDNFELLHTNKLASDDMCLAAPAPAGDRLLIRTAPRLYCIRAREPAGH